MGSYSVAASDTGIRLLSRSSFNLKFNSFSRRNLSSAMLCFLLLPSPPALNSYGVDIILPGAQGDVYAKWFE